MYAARGKTISRRGASTGDFLQALSLWCSWDLIFHHTAPAPDSAPADCQGHAPLHHRPAFPAMDASLLEQFS
jgi:hypothetical protein